MCALKISRQCNRHKRDNLVDLAGYAETVAMVIDERARRLRFDAELMTETFAPLESLGLQSS